MSTRIRISGCFLRQAVDRPASDGQDPGAPPWLRPLPEVRECEQEREHERVEHLAALVRAADGVRDVVRERLDDAVRVVMLLDLEAGIAELAHEILGAVAGPNVARDVEVDPTAEDEPPPVVTG